MGTGAGQRFHVQSRIPGQPTRQRRGEQPGRPARRRTVRAGRLVHLARIGARHVGAQHIGGRRCLRGWHRRNRLGLGAQLVRHWSGPGLGRRSGAGRVDTQGGQCCVDVVDDLAGRGQQSERFARRYVGTLGDQAPHDDSVGLGGDVDGGLRGLHGHQHVGLAVRGVLRARPAGQHRVGGSGGNLGDAQQLGHPSALRDLGQGGDLGQRGDDLLGAGDGRPLEHLADAR